MNQNKKKKIGYILKNSMLSTNSVQSYPSSENRVRGLEQNINELVWDLKREFEEQIKKFENIFLKRQNQEKTSLIGELHINLMLPGSPQYLHQKLLSPEMLYFFKNKGLPLLLNVFKNKRKESKEGVSSNLTNKDGFSEFVESLLKDEKMQETIQNMAEQYTTKSSSKPNMQDMFKDLLENKDVQDQFSKFVNDLFKTDEQ